MVTVIYNSLLHWFSRFRTLRLRHACLQKAIESKLRIQNIMLSRCNLNTMQQRKLRSLTGHVSSGLNIRITRLNQAVCHFARSPRYPDCPNSYASGRGGVMEGRAWVTRRRGPGQASWARVNISKTTTVSFTSYNLGRDQDFMQLRGIALFCNSRHLVSFLIVLSRFEYHKMKSSLLRNV